MFTIFISNILVCIYPKSMLVGRFIGMCAKVLYPTPSLQYRTFAQYTIPLANHTGLAIGKGTWCRVY